MRGRRSRSDLRNAPQTHRARLELGLERERIARRERQTVRRLVEAEAPAPVKRQEAGARTDGLGDATLRHGLAPARGDLDEIAVVDAEGPRVAQVHLEERLRRAPRERRRMRGTRERVPVIPHAPRRERQWVRLINWLRHINMLDDDEA